MTWYSAAVMRVEWDGGKNHRNLLKHEVRFETAMLVFDDPFALTQRDPTSDEEDRLTLGAIGPDAVLLVVHTSFGNDQEEIIRIISARAATSYERKKYEEAHTGTKARHRRHRGKERPGH